MTFMPEAVDNVVKSDIEDLKIKKNEMRLYIV